MFLSHRPRRRGRLILLAIVAAAVGCGKSGEGANDYDKMVAGRQTATGSLASSGAKCEEKQYPIGKAWVVDLRGVTITPELLKQVKQLGNVAELNLSKTNVTDDHLRTMHELELHTLLAKLDLSNTAVTDAGLQHLAGNLFLMELNLTGTGVTAAAVEQFKKARQDDPKVKIKNTAVKR